MQLELDLQQPTAFQNTQKAKKDKKTKDKRRKHAV